MEQLTLEIAGMSCQHCVHAIQSALDVLPGVANVFVDLADATVTLDIDASQTTCDAIKAAINNAGYEVKK